MLDSVLGDEVLVGLLAARSIRLVDFDDSVFDVTVEGDGLIRRQSPWRGGPDQSVHIVAENTLAPL